MFLLYAALPIITWFNSVSANPIDEGEILTLQCAASGVPAPEISFERDGVGIVANPPTVTITPGNESTLLQFQSVKAEDTGTYRCIASNVVGTATRELEIQVNLERPRSKGHGNSLRMGVLMCICQVTFSAYKYVLHSTVNKIDTMFSGELQTQS